MDSSSAGLFQQQDRFAPLVIESPSHRLDERGGQRSGVVRRQSPQVDLPFIGVVACAAKLPVEPLVRGMQGVTELGAGDSRVLR
jgi:hypothetical protein